MVRPVTDDDIGLKVLREAPVEAAQIIDIVAIHGIGAHPDESWRKNVGTAASAQWVNWLDKEDMLPAVVPHARIMRYGYQSQWFGEGVMRQKASTVARRLLLALKRKREEYPYRPLIFLAHCFGGLVVLKALVDARHDEHEWRGIFISTTGLVFFGTPFRGAEGISQVEMLEAARREYQEDEVQIDVLKILEPGNEFLQEVVDQFGKTRILANRAEVACFYELKSSNVGEIVGKEIRTRFVVSESSGCIDLSNATNKFSLSRSHFDMNKFGKPTEEDFETVRDVVKNMAGGAYALVLARFQYDNKHKIDFSLRGIPVVSQFVGRDTELRHLERLLPNVPLATIGEYGPNIVKDMKTVTEAPWVVPFTRPPSFAGRETQLAQLNAHVSLEGSRRLGIYGLGGCGKTALALESAYRMREHQPTRAIFWVPALSLESFEQAYREIGKTLRILDVADDKANVKQLVKARLNDEDFGSWLIIVDNADDTNILFNRLDRESSGDRLIDFLPCSSRKGSIVFTTRTREAAVNLAGNSVIQLGKLDKEEAEKVLRTRLLPNNQYLLEEGKIVHEFLDMLAFLALAIVQAVAFINKNNSTLSEYISVYRDSDKDAIELLRKEFEDDSRYRDTKNPVATTWHISFKQIQKQNSLAADYLSFMAYTTGENIPGSLLLPGSSKLATIEAIGMLDAYAFATERRQLQKGDAQCEERWFDIHRLVRLAMHNWLREHGQWNSWANRVLARLVEVVPLGDYCKRETWTAYLPHAIYVVDLPEVYKAEERMLLLDRIGRCERRLGLYKAAEVAYRKLSERREEVLGKENPNTLTSINNVAQALSRQGKYAEAEKMHRETLALRGKVLGKEHPETLMSMNNLAQALSCQGKYAEAEKIHRETLALREKVLRKEHPETLASINNLAQALSRQGKYTDAEKMHQETLALREKVLGKEDPETLRSIDNLARALRGQKKYAKAEKMHQKTLALREKVLGKEHPDTLTSMDNLARALRGRGSYVEAEKMHQETLALREKVLGKEHPHTLTSMSNLAEALSDQEKYAAAEKMHQDTLALREKVLGKEHPDTLMSMANLALVFWNQERWSAAEQLEVQVMKSRKKELGERHPDTLTIMANLALTWKSQGQEKDALLLMGECSWLQQQVLGPEHPDTLSSLQTLDDWQTKEGSVGEGKRRFRA